ncbi:glucose-1-phosphate thymidylyltransferase [Natronorubrum thiooxidans]|uniref:Glucose-1-phosphate thymidylyltransferase n=2 Tax=Natronorubrum thiooxidans TaxID=308853 RepID=A0A1N7FSM4_9EURY|nr:glucose-1-phosphate thymidylyltransferase [Natronorubrum thiooxidans]
MLPAATRPILEHVFDQLIDAGIAEIVVVGYRRDRVQSHFGPTYRNVQFTYVTQEHQFGTGDALLTVESAVDGTYLAINGDQIVGSRLIRETIDGHEHDAAATLALLQRTDIGEYGSVTVDDGEIMSIVENPSDWRDYYINAGVYVLEPTAFDAVRAAESRNGEHLLVDGLSELVDSGRRV